MVHAFSYPSATICSHSLGAQPVQVRFLTSYMSVNKRAELKFIYLFLSYHMAMIVLHLKTSGPDFCLYFYSVDSQMLQNSKGFFSKGFNPGPSQSNFVIYYVLHHIACIQAPALPHLLRTTLISQTTVYSNLLLVPVCGLFGYPVNTPRVQSNIYPVMSTARPF